MDRWDLLIVAVAAYVAVMTLTRLMAGRRNELVSDVREQVAQERIKQQRTAVKAHDHEAT